MELTKNLVILDIETTGTWIERDKIIEIGLIKVTPAGERIEYCKKLNPGIRIPEFIEQLTGITNDMVKSAPLFKTVAQEIVDFLNDADLAGFNLERFDLPLLERELMEAGIRFPWRERNIFDTQKVYHMNEKRDLSAAYKFYCEQELKGAHSALVDADATYQILVSQAQKYGEGDHPLNSLLRFNYQVSSEFYDSEKRFRWWNGKLYMMFGKYAFKYSLDEMVKRDSKYLEWILSANFGPEVKELIANALNGQLPEYKSTLTKP
ncbi:MAG: 3'-5' exonuclease [Candidatus Omnitrophica bacterium]|nr:3'-5' exonuclease [Candidatus Omnitrophota bacterium]